MNNGGTGSFTADLLGLYHFTTTTNVVAGLEVKETNSIVDLGYHYVAVSNQLTTISPIDSDGGSVPDYLEDANGNGIADPGESDWRNPSDD